VNDLSKRFFRFVGAPRQNDGSWLELQKPIQRGTRNGSRGPGGRALYSTGSSE
jgi:hypothetical protein